MTHTQRIARVYPRLDMGGAERGILQLLAEIPDTHMVVTHVEGLLAPRARELAARYTLCQPPRFRTLLDALQGCEVVHAHTINDHPLIPLAAQLAGPRVFVQTVHNRFEAQTSLFVDHSIALGPESAALLDAPGRTRVIPNAVEAPEKLPPFRPWTVDGRRLRLVEVRRPDKEMAFTLEKLLTSAALEDLDCEARIVGCAGGSRDPRVTYLGPLDDPRNEVARADLLVHGSATETFGRTVAEAMAWGTPPLATPLPAFRDAFTPDAGSAGGVAIFPGFEVGPAAAAMRALVDGPLGDPAHHQRVRAANHRLVRERFSVASMATANEQVYLQVGADDHRSERSFWPEDAEGGDLDLFGTLVDDLLEGQPPRQVSRYGELAPGLRGIYLWLAARSGRLPAPQRLPALAQALQLLGERPVVCLDLARELRAGGRASQALRLLVHYNQLRPWSLAGWVERVDLLMQSRQPSAALEAVEGALAAIPGAQPFVDLRGRLAGIAGGP